MKQILPVLFLILLFFSLFYPPSTHATISFQISNPKREGDYFIIEASISGISSSSAFIQGMFTNQSSSDYFGQTWGQKEDWVDYLSTTNKDFINTKLPILLRDTPQLIWVRPNYENSGYKGPGDYDFKFRRFTGSGDSSAGESNKLVITLLEPLPTPTPTSTPSQSPTPSETPTPTPTTEAVVTLNPTKTPTPTPIKTPTKAPTPLLTKTTAQLVDSSKIGFQKQIPSGTSSSTIETFSSTISGEVLGDSTESGVTVTSTPFPNYPKSSFTNPVILKYTFVFGLIVLSLSGGLLYFRHRND